MKTIFFLFSFLAWKKSYSPQNVMFTFFLFLFSLSTYVYFILLSFCFYYYYFLVCKHSVDVYMGEKFHGSIDNFAKINHYFDIFILYRRSHNQKRKRLFHLVNEREKPHRTPMEVSSYALVQLVGSFMHMMIFNKKLFFYF